MAMKILGLVIAAVITATIIPELKGQGMKYFTLGLYILLAICVFTE